MEGMPHPNSLSGQLHMLTKMETDQCDRGPESNP